MDIQDITRVMTLVIWILALIGSVWSVWVHPRDQWKERAFYVGIVASYILHVIVFFVFLIVPSDLSPAMKNLWSKGVYIHGGIALLFKEIAAILRVGIYKQRNGDI